MPIMPSILVIDDEESMRVGCVQTLSEEGYAAQAAENGAQGLEMAQRESFDLVVLDLRMPGLDGMEVLRKLREVDPDLVVIVITGYATIESAVEAMRRGAYDFLPKPFTPETLLAIVRRAVEQKRLMLENVYLRRELDQRIGADVVVGRSPVMVQAMEPERPARQAFHRGGLRRFGGNAV